MPFKRRTTRKRGGPSAPKKRAPPRRRSSRRRVPRPILSGFPSSKLVKLRYVQEISLNASAAGPVQNVFRANGAYDPDLTGAGHQPMGFDEWANIYQRYCVVGSKITMQFVPTQSTNVIPAYFGVTLTPTSSGLTFADPYSIFESKLTGNNYKIGGLTPTNDGKGRFAMVTKNFSAKRYFGVKNIRDCEDYSALSSTIPVQHAYFACWTNPINGNDPDAMSFKIVIDYIILWTKPTLLEGS